jgi:hypothetical protein
VHEGFEFVESISAAAEDVEDEVDFTGRTTGRIKEKGANNKMSAPFGREFFQ